MSESDINEADFTAVLSLLQFDLLDLHLLGFPVPLQNGERGMDGTGVGGGGSRDRSWNEPTSLLAGPTKAEPFIIQALRPAQSTRWRPKKGIIKTLVLFPGGWGAFKGTTNAKILLKEWVRLCDTTSLKPVGE